MRKIVSFLIFILISFFSYSQNLLNDFNHLNHIQKDFNYVDEEILKKGINKELAFAKASKAIESIAVGDFDKAYKDIKEVIELDPENGYSYILKGICCLELDSVEVSKNAFNKAAKLDSLNPVPHYYIGNINLYEKKYKEAISNYNHSIKLNEEFYLGYYGLGNVYLSQGKITRAKNMYNKAVFINKGFYECFYNLGLIEISLDKKKNALKYFFKAVTANNQFSPAYYMLGILSYYEHNYYFTLENWNKAIEFDPDNPFYLISRGILNIELKDYNSAYIDIQKLLEINKEANQKYADLSDDSYIEKRQNKLSQFILYEENKSEFQEPITSMFKKYLCFLLVGDYSSAQSTIDKINKIDDSNSITSYFMGYIAEYYGVKSQAITYYEKSISQSPFIYMPYLKLGVIQYRDNNYSKSIEYLNKFITYNDTAKIAYRCRGISYMKTDNLENAIIDFNHFLKVDSSDLDILFNRAVCYHNLGHYENAIEDFNELLKHRGDDNDAYYLRAECKLYNSDTIGALDDLNHIHISYYNLNTKAFLLRGTIKVLLKRYTDAIFDFNLGLENEPENIEMLGSRGRLLYSIRDYQSALIDFDNLIKLDPNEGGSYYIRGLIYIKLRKFKKACKDFNVARSKGYPVPENAFSICNL
jgi:tetratricopeptide (TPR) repeat protein